MQTIHDVVDATPSDKACELLADLLKDGPRGASEILVAAEGVMVRKRTMQRAANMLQVTKTRAAFRGGWMWRLPDEAESTEAPSQAKESGPESVMTNAAISVNDDDIRRHCEPVSVDNIKQHSEPVSDDNVRQHRAEPARDRNVSQPFAERAEIIAARLRKLEAGRGKKAPIFAGDSRLMGWVRAGISDPDLREAYELAVFALERSHSQAPVTVGFLCDFVEKVIAEGATA